MRFYLAKLHLGEFPDCLPPVPPMDPACADARAAVLLAQATGAQSLAREVEGLGIVNALRYTGFLGCVSPVRTREKPSRGECGACYRLERVDGPALAKALRTVPDLRAIALAEGEAVVRVGLAATLRDRLEILVSQHGLARKV